MRIKNAKNAFEHLPTVSQNNCQNSGQKVKYNLSILDKRRSITQHSGQKGRLLLNILGIKPEK